jgi:hypothetical protein
MTDLKTVFDDGCVAISLLDEYFIDFICHLVTDQNEGGYFDTPRWIGGSF